jgi:hypothetical protein
LEFGAIVDRLGAWVDVFAHWTDVTTDDDLLFTDLQGFVDNDQVVLIDPQTSSKHSIGEGNTGVGDCGERGIALFRKDHRCNAICKKTGFKPYVIEV